jgi:hypothetical protein
MYWGLHEVHANVHGTIGSTNIVIGRPWRISTLSSTANRNWIGTTLTASCNRTSHVLVQRDRSESNLIAVLSCPPPQSVGPLLPVLASIPRSALLAAVLVTALVHCSHTWDMYFCRSPLCWRRHRWGALLVACDLPYVSFYMLDVMHMIIWFVSFYFYLSLWYCTYVESSTGPFILILLNVNTQSDWHCSGWLRFAIGLDDISSSYMYVTCFGQTV